MRSRSGTTRQRQTRSTTPWLWRGPLLTEHQAVQDANRANVSYLDFSSDHSELAKSIAPEAALRAAEVGSGRVGRTRTLEINERAALAARAFIRHRYTAYEDRLGQEVWNDEYLYREVKADAHRAVDQFLERHRPPPAERGDKLG